MEVQTLEIQIQPNLDFRTRIDSLIQNVKKIKGAFEWLINLTMSATGSLKLNCDRIVVESLKLSFSVNTPAI